MSRYRSKEDRDRNNAVPSFGMRSNLFAKLNAIEIELIISNAKKERNSPSSSRYFLPRVPLCDNARKGIDEDDRLALDIVDRPVLDKK